MENNNISGGKMHKTKLHIIFSIPIFGKKEKLNLIHVPHSITPSLHIYDNMRAVHACTYDIFDIHKVHIFPYTIIVATNPYKCKQLITRKLLFEEG